MSEQTSVLVQIEKDGDGNGWTDLSNDVRQADTLVFRYGMSGNTPLERLGDAGSLTFALDNSAFNSVGLVGRYTPGHINALTGWDTGVGVRVGIKRRRADHVVLTSSVADPTVITTSGDHMFSTGDNVVLSGHVGSTPDINGTYTITVIDDTHFSIPVAVTVAGAGGIVYSENTAWKWRGYVSDIDPEPGRYGSQRAFVTASDWLGLAAKTRAAGLGLQVSKRADELFQTAIALVSRAPGAVEKDTGLDTLPYAFDDIDPITYTIYMALNDIAMTEFGYIYQKGDFNQGGTLVFENRARRGKASANLQTFDSVMTGMTPTRSSDLQYTTIQFTVHPRRVDASPTSVVYQLSVANGDTAIQVDATSSVTFQASYRDPSQKAVGIGATNLQSLVPGVDYVANTEADGTGADITSSVAITVVPDSASATITVQNNNTRFAAFITLLQLKGQGLYNFNDLTAIQTDADLAKRYGDNLLQIDMSMQPSAVVGQATAQYVLGLLKDPTTNIDEFTFVANESDDLMEALLRREISDRIGVVEYMSGVSTATADATVTKGYFINWVEVTVSPGPWFLVRYGLAPSDQSAYWQWGIPGRSEVGTTTRFFYGLFRGHVDSAHLDAHDDVAHEDTPHEDSAHADAHTDSPHQDVNHADLAHGDADHADLSHTDTPHTDTPHQDAVHQDVAHSDVPHNDSAFADAHTDTAHNDRAHSDSHTDVPHADTAHSDHSDHSDFTDSTQV